MSRRKFSSGVVVIALSTGVFGGRAEALPNGVASGEVTQDAALIWSRRDTVGTLTLEVASDAGFSSIVANSTTNVADPLLPVKLAAGSLTPNTQYFYRATTPEGDSVAGQFRTAAAIGTRTGVTFGVSGDWRGELLPYPGVSNVPGRSLDFFVALGDTIYADFPSPAVPAAQATTLTDYRTKNAEVYSEKFGVNTLADLRASTPIWATIDDHEVINDFSGGADPATDPRFTFTTESFVNQTQLYKNGLQAFQEYNPIAAKTYSGTGDPRFDGAPNLYRSQSYGSDAAIFIPDARSFRDQELAAANPNNPASVLNFLVNSFNPTRTMLGATQLSQLKSDLLAADNAGVQWKFVMVPEPIQNLGVVGAGDRFEGYAAERSDLLRFIKTNDIDNVVFIAADIHGTIVNNLTYQDFPGGPQIPVQAWEITTGSLAFDAPFGPTVVELAEGLGVLPPGTSAFYNSLPLANKEAFIANLINGQLNPLGYDLVGLQGSGINFNLLAGGFTATNTYGWTEFDIDPNTGLLTVTTFGIDPYNESQVNAGILSRAPRIVSQFQVAPEIPEPASLSLLALSTLGLATGRRRRTNNA